MDKFFEASASATPPAVPSPGSTGWPVDGAAGVPGTIPGAYAFYMLFAELLAVITAGGLTPDKANLTQLRDAIKKLVSSGATLANPGHCYLGPLLLNWGVSGSCSSGSTVSISFHQAFSATPYWVGPVAPSYNSQVGSSGYSTSGATLSQNSDGGGAITMSWLAIGPA